MIERRPYEIDCSHEPWAGARRVADRLHAAGYQAVFVGGAVRDHLLGRPVKDVDVATDAPPSAVAACFERTLDVGRQFGIVVVVLAAGRHVEVASFRSETGYTDHRRPDRIAPSDEAGDVARRDFTINALVYDPQLGELRDHVGGLADLRAGRLRTVGDPARRFAEDRLRILRALRFASQCQLELEPDTAAALVDASLAGLSRERIWDEWQRGLAHPSRGDWWAAVARCRLATGVCPLLVGDHTEPALALLPAAASSTVAIAALLRGIAGQRRWTWLRGEPVSKPLRRRIEQLAAGADVASWNGLDDAAATRRALDPDLAELPPLLRALGAPELGADVAARRQRWGGRLPAPLLDGEDLRRLGVDPGPRLGRWQRAIEDARLRGELADRDAARDRVRAWLAADGP